MKLQHSKTCYECSEIPGTNSYVGDQTTREQNFQCSKCGLKFTDRSNLENHIVESHEVTCGILDTKIGNDPHFEYKTNLGYQSYQVHQIDGSKVQLRKHSIKQFWDIRAIKSTKLAVARST